MWTKIVNALGFWTKKQIAEQYKSPQADWWDEYQATNSNSIIINLNPDPELIDGIMRDILTARNQRRLKVAQDYLDGNDNWKEKTNVD